MAKFARLAAQQELELRQKEMATCSTCLGNARAHPDARPLARRVTLDPRPVPIKPTKTLTVQPGSLSAMPKRKFTGVRSAHVVPAAARAPATPALLHPHPIPRLASSELSEAPRALRPSTTSPEVPD
jgi:hypothetical protein